MEEKVFTISFDWWECKVSIEQTEETIANLKEMLLFWSGGQRRIDDADGDIQQAWLIMFAQEVIDLSQRYNIQGIIEEINEMEGWFPVDGSMGIKLLSSYGWHYDDTDFEIKST